MPDKQTPKAFEDFYIANGKFEMNGTTKSYDHTWNAATEATRAECDDKIKAMQAEIDKRDVRIKELERDRVNRLFKYRDALKELNQRGEDE